MKVTPTDIDPAGKIPVANQNSGALDKSGESQGFFDWLRTVAKGKSETTLRESIEDYIEEAERNHEPITSLTAHERALITNILKLRDMAVTDVMIPRADIVAIDVKTTQRELFELISERQFSRIPVYRDTLDDVLGTLHIKDMMGALARGEKIEIGKLVRDVPIVSPSMHLLDLLLLMKHKRRHMVLVVDEYGGIDGLATVGDVIESIVGELEDEYDQESQPVLIENPDGSVTVDGRFDIEEFEKKFGSFLNDEEREDIDTLGGLVFTIAGRVPARGEILAHTISGMVFEILDADPRRVNRLLVKNISPLHEPLPRD